MKQVLGCNEQRMPYQAYATVDPLKGAVGSALTAS